MRLSVKPSSVLSGCAASLMLLALGGCRVGPVYQRPAMPAPPAYKETTPPPAIPGGEWKTADPRDAALKGKWWMIFGDESLNRLEDSIAVSNQTLRAATQRYLQAREQVAVARADFFPQLSAGPGYSANELSTNRPNFSKSTTKRSYNDINIGGQASWEPDLWGRVRHQVENAQASQGASAADLANLDLSLHAELALDYLQLRGLDTEQQLLDATVTDFQRSLDLTDKRFHGGVSTDADVALARTQLESTRAQAIDLAVARASYEHAIAVLIGVPASQFHLPPAPLNLALPRIPAGIPSDLLERRPDVAAAERRAAAANAEIGVAISAYYPNITLGGSGGFESTHIGTWIQGPSALWSLGGSATELLFDAGRRHALTAQAREGYEANVANYRATVLNGFREVEDNLATLRILEQEAATEHAAVASAEHSLSLSTNRYRGGVTSYLEVLAAENARLQNQRTEADINTRRFTATVQLIRALGGSWDRTQLPR